MQQVTFSHPNTSPPANKWFATRRNYHIRKLYTLFFKTHTDFVKEVQNNSIHFDQKNTLLASDNNRGNLWQLKDLVHSLFQESNYNQQHGQHLNWAIHAIFHATIKFKANIRMNRFHHLQAQNQEENDAGHTAFIETIIEETQKQIKTLELLFDHSKDVLRLLLIDQTGNDLLLRLLIEEEDMTKVLWNESTMSLFSDMFPHQPEAGYVQAGKSYFMAGWLAEALTTYEKSLTINNNLSESRRQTYLIRAMIKDRDHIKQ